MIDQVVQALRGLIARGVVTGDSDAGETQTVDVQTHEGILRGAIEVLQPFGLASRAPIGGLTVVLSIGGDQGDMVALPVSSPATRFGNLAEGECVVHDSHGNRVALRSGVIEILQATKVLIRAPRCEIEASGGAKITGDVEIVGNLIVSGDVTDHDATGGSSLKTLRDAYNAHKHTQPNDGHGDVEQPTNTTDHPV